MFPFLQYEPDVKISKNRAKRSEQGIMPISHNFFLAISSIFCSLCGKMLFKVPAVAVRLRQLQHADSTDMPHRSKFPSSTALAVLVLLPGLSAFAQPVSSGRALDFDII